MIIIHISTPYNDDYFRMKDCHSIVILLKFLLLVDVLSLTTCVGLVLCYGYLPPQKMTINRLTLLYIILMLGSYGVLSLLCNCLATYGVKNRIKTFLVPYLIFYPMVVAITSIFLTNSVLSYQISAVSLVLPIFISVVISLLWLRFVRFWFVLSTITSRPRGDSLETGESMWSQSSLESPARDTPPPPYDSPPGYEEAVSALPCCQEKERR